MKKIPRAVVARLTKYLTYALSLSEEKVKWVSSQEISDALGVTSATIRRDLLHLNISGVTNRGYVVEKLCGELLSFLGADVGWNVVVVGAGNLGKALAMHGDLHRRGFSVCGIFDCDGRKVGTRVGQLNVQSMEELPQVVSKKDVDIGVISVPGASAQNAADILIASGVKGIFNLSLTHIAAPRRTIVVEGRLIAGMLELGHALKSRG